MRIPPSVFVMSLVTAVPFGLAVKDTLHPPKTRAQIDAEKERQYELDMEKQADADRQAEERAAAARKAKLATYIGQKPAELGSWFGTVHLGTRADDAEMDALDSKSMDAAAGIGFVKRGGVLSEITIPGDDNCEDLRDVVVAAWHDAPDGVYLDPETHQRAMFQNCELTFDRYLEVDSWIDRKADAPVSLSLVGMSADKLRTTLGDRLENDDGNTLEWYVPGIGRGSMPTHIVANLELNKVTGLHVNVPTDGETSATVQARLTTLLGKPTIDPDTEIVTWTGRVPVTLQSGYGDLTIELGR